MALNIGRKYLENNILKLFDQYTSKMKVED